MRSGDPLAMLDLDGAAQVILTRQGRRLLSERVRVLRVEVLPQLRAALEDPERDGHVDAEFDRAVEELRHLAWVVDHAAIAEDVVGEPAVVELGTVVTIGVRQGVLERFLIVHPIEAPLDDLRISVRSPLAQALLGHQVGEEVEVAAPSGPYRCRIVAVESPPVGPDAAPPTLDTTQYRGTDMRGGQPPVPASQRAVEAWVALGGGVGVGIGARLGNVLFWIVIGAIAGLAIGSPEDGS